MKPWTSATALILAGAMLAGSAFAQTTTPSGDQKAKEGMKSEGTKSDSGMNSESGRTGSMSGRGEQVKAVQQALKDGFNIFLDVDRLGVGHFDEALLRMIEAAPNFTVLP